MRAKERINGVEVEVICDVIDSEIEQEGLCPPARLVELSRPEDSPTHDLFQWDDAIAAEIYRVEQARRVIRRIPIKLDGEREQAPRYVHIQRATDSGRIDNGYTQTVRALKGEHREAVMRDALAALKGLRARYESLHDFAPVWRAIDEVEQRVEEMAA